MSIFRRPFTESRAWQPTTPGALLPSEDDVRPRSQQPGRAQPPLQEVLKGLDARELEGQTVFDQLFGPLPAGDPRLPPR